MPPTIHIIRTAEGVHYTRSSGNVEYHDPVLTKDGYEQCTKLASEIAGLGHEFAMVMASPMKRSIQTGLAIFREFLQSKKIVLLPDLQELGTYPADTGSSQEELERIFGTDAHIAVITHSHFLNHLLAPRNSSMFAFAERRTFRHNFTEDRGLPSILEETLDSVARREKKRLDAIPKGEYYNPFGFKVPDVPSVAETEQPSKNWMFAHKR